MGVGKQGTGQSEEEGKKRVGEKRENWRRRGRVGEKEESWRSREKVGKVGKG